VLRGTAAILVILGVLCVGFGVYVSIEVGKTSMLAIAIDASGASVTVVAALLFWRWHRNKILLFCYIMLLSFVIIAQLGFVAIGTSPKTRQFLSRSAATEGDMSDVAADRRIRLAIALIVTLIIVEILSWTIAFVRLRQLSSTAQGMRSAVSTGVAQSERAPLKKFPTESARSIVPSDSERSMLIDHRVCYEHVSEDGVFGKGNLAHEGASVAMGLGYQASAWPTGTSDDGSTTDFDAGLVTGTDLDVTTAGDGESGVSEFSGLEAATEERVRARYEKFYKRYNIAKA
jgi:hypothetical protein